MRTHFRICALLILFVSTGCSTIVSGRTQDISINSEPSGARCVVENNGDIIASVEHTPGVVTIDKSKNDILVKCTKEGYGSGRQKNHSDYAMTNIGNMALWQLSFVGNMVDSATGAANKYDSDVFVKINREPSFTDQQIAAAPAAQGATLSTVNSASSARAQMLAAQIAQEVNVAQQNTAAGTTLVISPHTQELASALVQEVAVIPVQQ